MVDEIVGCKSGILVTKEDRESEYLRPPHEANNDGLWKLKKIVYGLKDAAVAWYTGSRYTGVDGLRSKVDPSVFY